MSSAFVLWWSAPALMVWQLVGKLVTPMHDPLQQGLDIQNDSLILGEELHTQALLINVINNTLLFIGGSIAYLAFFWITRTSMDSQRHILQVLILAFAGWRFVNLTIAARINRLLKGEVRPLAEWPEQRLPTGYVIRLMAASFRGRLRAGFSFYL